MKRVKISAAIALFSFAVSAFADVTDELNRRQEIQKQIEETLAEKKAQDDWANDMQSTWEANKSLGTYGTDDE
jgi:Tfp pilus assembly protein PilV